MLIRSVAVARKEFADLVADIRVRKRRVIVTRYGIPVCALIPIEDLKTLDATVEARIQRARRSRRR